MRRPLPLATLGLSLLLGTAGFMAPAQSRVDESARAGLSCSLMVTGVDDTNHIKEYAVTNGEVTWVRSSKKLGFALTGLGFMSADTKNDTTTVRLVGTTPNGVPRQVTVTERRDSTSLPVKSVSFAQKSFKPRLFTDAYGYYAYTVSNAGALHRWTLTRLRSGKLAYRGRVTLAQNLDTVTALTTAAYRDKPAMDFLYMTTEAGELQLVKVPYAKPRKRSFKRLAAEGYAGVTELSSGYCNGVDRGVLATIDPVAGTATWTLVTDLRTPSIAKAVPKGSIQGEVSWALHAVM